MKASLSSTHQVHLFPERDYKSKQSIPNNPKQRKMRTKLFLITALIFSIQVFAQEGTPCPNGNFSDDFNDNALAPEWVLVDPNPDTEIGLDGLGALRVSAAAQNGGSILFPLFPSFLQTAPRIVQPVDPNADWTIETKVNFNPFLPEQSAGLITILHPDSSSNSFIQLIERASTENNEQVVQGHVLGNTPFQDPYNGATIYLRARKTTNRITTWYSNNGINWTQLSDVEQTTSPDYVGVYVTRMTDESPSALPAIAHFDYFKVDNCPLLDECEALQITTQSTPEIGNNQDGTASAEANGASQPFSYRWLTDPPVNAATITGLASGFYAVEVTDNQGCKDTAEAFVNWLPCEEFETPQAPGDSLFAYYPLDCNAMDASGNENHATVIGAPDCVKGVVNKAFVFNTTPQGNGCGLPGGEYIQLPTMGPIWEAGITVCAWADFRANNNYERIFDFGNGSGESGGHPIWFGRVGTSQDLALESWINSSTNINNSTGRLVATGAANLESIEFYCATIEGNTMKIYVGGELVAEKEGHPILNVERANNFLGHSNWCNNDPDFKGFMDEVRIYNRALSAEEIRGLYGCQDESSPEICNDQIDNDGDDLVDDEDPDCACDLGGGDFPDPDNSAPAELVLYYDFENCDGNEVSDLSGNSNNGTLLGGAECGPGLSSDLGNALHLNGDGAYVQTPLNGNFLPVSMSVQFQTNTSSGEHSIIDSDIYQQSGYSLTIGLWDGGNTLDIQYHDGHWDSGYEINPGLVYHAIALIDSTEVSLYVNGAFVGSSPYNLGSLNGDNFRLGRSNIFDHQWFDGLIDEVRIYEGLLTEAEICELFNGAPSSPLSVMLEQLEEIPCHQSTTSITANANGGTPPYTYLWSDGQNEATANFLGIGTYQVTVTDAESSETSAEINIEGPSPISLAYTVLEEISCPGDVTAVEITAGGGTPPYSYAWSDGQTGATATGLESGVYQVTVSDANDCTETSEILIESDDNMAPSAAFDFILNETSVSLTDNSSGMPTDWEWTIDGAFASTEQNPVFTLEEGGTYEVCLTVSNNCGEDIVCQEISIPTPEPTDSVTFIIDQVSGPEGSELLVPVYVKNFNEVTSFQFSLHLSDPGLAIITDITGYNLPHLNSGNFLIEEDLVTVVWVDFDINGISEADSTVIFYLKLELAGQRDECVNLSIDGTPTAVEVSTLQSTGPTTAPYLMQNGEACITQSLVSVSGRVTKETGFPLNGVVISCTGLDPDTTGSNGTFSFADMPSQNDYTLSATKEDDPKNGVTAIDMVYIQSHILGEIPLSSPYRILAADVNGSKTITALDLIFIRQLLLGYVDEFPGGLSWRFVPSAYEFPEPENPFFYEIPESIQLANVQEDVLDQDFIGIKLGDVNLNADGLNDLDERFQLSLPILLNDQEFQAGEEVILEVRSGQAIDLLAIQLALGFDSEKLILKEGIEVGDKPGTAAHFGPLEATRQVSFLWHTEGDLEDPIRFEAGDSFFKLPFKALKAGNLSEAIFLDEQILRGKAYTIDQQFDIELNFKAVYLEIEPETKVSVFPNPTTGPFKLELNMPTHAEVQIELLNSNGQLIKSLLSGSRMGKGNQQIDFDLSGLESGTYYLRVRGLARLEGLPIIKI